VALSGRIRPFGAQADRLLDDVTDRPTPVIRRLR